MMDESELYTKIKLLNERLWENRVTKPLISRWLACFADPSTSGADRELALYLLSRVIYFGETQVRELLRVLFRDHYRYPIVAEFRRAHSDTLDMSTIANAFDAELRATRFLGVGNPAESGTHLLYYFRQENQLDKDLFINTHEVFAPAQDGLQHYLRNPDIHRYIFIDDFCGSGRQATRYSEDLVQEMKTVAHRSGISITVDYFVLCGTSDGLKRVSESSFDGVRCAIELDDSYRCFAFDSRCFADDRVRDQREAAEEMSRRYGARLTPKHPLGFGNGQLLISFHHNTPNNTLPIIWSDINWVPIFRRYSKYEGLSR